MKTCKRLFSLLLCLICFATSQAYADRTFTHPAEDNGSENLTLSVGSYTFTVDANPNGYHWVEWYNTYSGGSPIATAHLYYYDDQSVNLSTSGWVRAEVYKSNISGAWEGWEASYRWYVTVYQPHPDLIAYSCSVSDTTVNTGQSVSVRWTAKNQGTGGAGSTQQGVMWSSNSTISRSDTLLEKEYLGSMGVNATSPEDHTITIPTNATPGQTYYLGAYADYDLDESESDENNNGSNGVAVTINYPPQPDLIAYGASVSDTTVDPGQSVTVYWTAKNQGADSAGSTYQGVMWSSNSTISRSDALLEKGKPLAEFCA